MVKILLFLVHVPVVGPRLGNGHHHGLRQRHTAHQKKFQRVVQHGAVASLLVHHGQHLAHILAQHLAANALLAGKHGIHIAANGVDLAVVQNIPVGVGAHPAGAGVGGKTTVHHADGALVVFVLQIGIKAAQLAYQKHSFIYNGAAGKAAHIGGVVALLKHAAHHIQLAVKRKAAVGSFGALDKALPDIRHTVQRLLAQNFGVRGHLAPAQKLHPLLAADDLEHFHGMGAPGLLLLKKEHTHSVVTLFRQADADLRRSLYKKLMADLQKNAHAVAGFSLGILTGTVLKMLHNVQGIGDGLVRFPALYIHDRANAAVVMLKLRLVQPRGGFSFGKIFHRLTFLS